MYVIYVIYICMIIYHISMFIYNTSQCVLCQQIIANTAFVNTQTKVKFDTYQKVFCKCTYDCELLECPLCKILSIATLLRFQVLFTNTFNLS